MTVKGHPHYFCFDHELSMGVFGDSAYLKKNCDILYHHLSVIIRQKSEYNIPNFDIITQPSAYTIMRRLIDDAFSQLIRTGQIVLNSSLKELCNEFDKRGRFDTHHIRCGPLIFFSNWENDTYASEIRDSFVKSMYQEGASIYSVRLMPKNFLNSTQSALKILQKILPKTFLNTIKLISGIVVVRGGITSGYINDNPASFFINASQFSSPYLLGETLLHEALHEKMAQIRLTTNLIKPTYDDLDSEEAGDILVPWPDDTSPRRWSVARALAAFHVYCHTSVYYHLILTRTSWGVYEKKHIKTALVTHYERANYLADALKHHRSAQNFDYDGFLFLNWLTTILNKIENDKTSSNDTFEAMQFWSADDLQKQFN